jgi:hypothetical protein
MWREKPSQIRQKVGLDQKRVDDIKRVRLVLASGVSILTDIERNAIFASAETLDIRRE